MSDEIGLESVLRRIFREELEAVINQFNGRRDRLLDAKQAGERGAYHLPAELAVCSVSASAAFLPTLKRKNLPRSVKTDGHTTDTREKALKVCEPIPDHLIADQKGLTSL